MLYIGGEGGAGGDSEFDLALRSYRFESITLPGPKDSRTDTPIRIETAFHELHSSFQILAPSSELGLFKCVHSREIYIYIFTERERDKWT